MEDAAGSRVSRQYVVVRRAARPPTVAVRAQSEEERVAIARAQYEEAMKNPETAKKMQDMLQEQMKQPGVQEQMQMMQQMMQNPQLMARLQSLKDDPDMKPYFDEIKEKGMGAMMKLYSDQGFLNKLGSKLADVIPQAAPPTPPPAMEQEITDIISAAKFGDLEALEDFIAIGKVNSSDQEKRTALHMAAATNNVQIANTLITAGATVDSPDSKNNTPLHYAAGYGRPDVCRLLLEAGASGAAKNATGKTPFELVKLSPQNPINMDEDLLYQLEFSSKATA